LARQNNPAHFSQEWLAGMHNPADTAALIALEKGRAGMPTNLPSSPPGARKNITGDEKGQAQIFLDRCFKLRPIRLSGCTGAPPNSRRPQIPRGRGGTAFADLALATDKRTCLLPHRFC